MIAIAKYGDFVSPHFGQSQAYDIYALEDGKAVFKESLPTNGEHVCHSVIDFKGYPVDTMIVGGLGQGALNRLTGEGLTVIRGAQGPIAEAVQAYAEGRLESVGDVCNHHHH